MRTESRKTIDLLTGAAPLQSVDHVIRCLSKPRNSSCSSMRMIPNSEHAATMSCRVAVLSEVTRCRRLLLFARFGAPDFGRFSWMLACDTQTCDTQNWRRSVWEFGAPPAFRPFVATDEPTAVVRVLADNRGRSLCFLARVSHFGGVERRDPRRAFGPIANRETEKRLMHGCSALTDRPAKESVVLATQGDNMDEKKEEEDAANTENSTGGSTLGGAVAGAVAGTALGAPVVGTVIGALSGAAIGAARKRTTGPQRKAKPASATPKKKASTTKKRSRKTKPKTKPKTATARAANTKTAAKSKTTKKPKRTSAQARRTAPKATRSQKRRS